MHTRYIQTYIQNLTNYLLQDVPGSWGQPVDPSQWSAYYGYGQGYDPYAYGATQDPSLYAYSGYASYGQYPQQARLFKFSFAWIHMDCFSNLGLKNLKLFEEAVL